MQNSYYVLTLLATGISAFSTAPAMGQDYPNRVVHIVTAPVGGNSDLGARLIAAGLTASLGQPAVVEPRQGGTIGGEIVAKAAPDGYTLFYTGNIFWTLPLINKDISYDVVRDFMPITLATREPLVVAVHPSLPTRTVRELIALAKARPGQINFGTGGIGSSNHIAAEMFKTMAGVNIVGVRYRGVGGALIGLIAGEVQVLIATSLGPYFKSGKLRALAVTTLEPTPLYPGLPTVTASGLPGYEASQKAGIFVPVKTPVAIVNRLNREIVQFLGKPETRQRFMSEGIDVVGSTPEEYLKLIKIEISSIGKVIKDAGVSAN